jgi:hypothetical protein
MKDLDRRDAGDGGVAQKATRSEGGRLKTTAREFENPRVSTRIRLETVEKRV